MFFKQFSSDLQHTEACSECRQVKHECTYSQTNRLHGRMITVSILKPLHAILSSKDKQYTSYLVLVCVIIMSIQGCRQKKIFWGFQKGGSKIAGSLEGTAPRC